MEKYEKYKPSGIEWIGEIPEHWNLATVGRVTNIGRGRVISNIEIGENEGEYPVYSSQTENNGVMGYLNTFDFEGEYVTWTTDGANAGTVFHREGKFNCTNVCGTIQPKNWNQIDLRFLPYFLNLGTRYSVRLDINPKLMNNMMAKIPFIIPPTEEQTSIASFLDSKTSVIDKIIANKQKLITLYKEEKQAVINKAVTKGINPDVKLKPSGVEWLGDVPKHWDVKKLKYIVTLITEKSDGEEIKIALENIESKTGKYIKSNSVFEGDGIHFNIGYILYGKLRPYLAKVWVSEFEGSAVGDFFVLKLLKNYNSNFLKYRLLSTSFTNVANGSTFGAKMPRVGWDFMSDLYFAFPKLEEQETIVFFIEQECNRIDLIIEKYKKQIELFLEYRITLISDVVTGKIKVSI
ncbi:MAG: restriction endonuclease subunit S [Bacteroidota bacterium]